MKLKSIKNSVSKHQVPTAYDDASQGQFTGFIVVIREIFSTS